MNANEMIARAEFLSQHYEDGKFQERSPREGAYRACLVEDGYAFKAVHNVRDVNANRAEWDFYAMTTDEIRAKLAKPVYISRNGLVIVMVAITPWRERKNGFEGNLSHWENELDELTKSTYGFNIGDTHGGNWGVDSEGNVLMLDYGSMEWHAKRWEHEKIPYEKRHETPEPGYHKEIMAEMLLTKSNN